MVIESIKELCHASPFRPFIIHFPDGRRLGVQHPDFVTWPMAGRLIRVFQPNGSESLVDLMLVSDVTIQAGRPRRNGKH